MQRIVWRVLVFYVFAGIIVLALSPAGLPEFALLLGLAVAMSLLLARLEQRRQRPAAPAQSALRRPLPRR